MNHTNPAVKVKAGLEELRSVLVEVELNLVEEEVELRRGILLDIRALFLEGGRDLNPVRSQAPVVHAHLRLGHDQLVAPGDLRSKLPSSDER